MSRIVRSAPRDTGFLSFSSSLGQVDSNFRFIALAITAATPGAKLSGTQVSAICDSALGTAYLFERRWPERFVCPGCGGGRAWLLKTKAFTYECADCGRQTSVTAGTIMHASKLPLTVWFWAAFLMTTHSNGISALQLQNQLALGSCRTAWMLCAKLRRAMVNPEREPLSGLVEADETIIPFRTKNDPIVVPAGRSGRYLDVQANQFTRTPENQYEYLAEDPGRGFLFARARPTYPDAQNAISIAAPSLKLHAIALEAESGRFQQMVWGLKKSADEDGDQYAARVRTQDRPGTDTRGPRSPFCSLRTKLATRRRSLISVAGASMAWRCRLGGASAGSAIVGGQVR